MAEITIDKISTLERLYTKEQYSARQIAEYFECSLDAVYYAMRKHKIKRRSRSQNSEIQFSLKPLSFKLKSPLTQAEQTLKIAGSILYWTEGYKTEKSAGVDFANCDVEMSMLFMKFLRDICGVNEERLRVLLYCHTDSNQQKLITFWSKRLGIPESQFTKPYVRQEYKLEKKNKMAYGLVHIRYMDKKLLRQILLWIEEYKESVRVGGGVV